jgi:hypothetical protein
VGRDLECHERGGWDGEGWGGVGLWKWTWEIHKTSPLQHAYLFILTLTQSVPELATPPILPRELDQIESGRALARCERADWGPSRCTVPLSLLSVPGSKFSRTTRVKNTWKPSFLPNHLSRPPFPFEPNPEIAPAKAPQVRLSNFPSDACASIAVSAQRSVATDRHQGFCSPTSAVTSSVSQ